MPAREMKFKLSEEEAEKHLSDETVELKLQQDGKIRRQDMEKISRGIKLIFPSMRRECSGVECIKRTNHRKNWTWR